MEIYEALEKTGFLLCDFKSDGEDLCNTCSETIPKGSSVYYERTCYETNEGEYHCESCTKAKPKQWEEEAAQWGNYFNDKIKGKTNG